MRSHGVGRDGTADQRGSRRTGSGKDCATGGTARAVVSCMSFPRGQCIFTSGSWMQIEKTTLGRGQGLSASIPALALHE